MKQLKKNEIIIASVSVIILVILAEIFFQKAVVEECYLFSFSEKQKAFFNLAYPNYIRYYMRFMILFVLLIDFLVLTIPGKNIFKSLQESFNKIDFKLFRKPFLIVAGIYLLGISSILRANFCYLDDTWRSIGYANHTFHWNRHAADLLSKIVHTGSMIADISPLTQILAVLLLAMATVLLVYVLCDKKIKTIALFAALPFGLSPYFLENISFKFDSPYMALSILLSIVPFIFTESKKIFCFVSVIALILMCSTYQASSGIFLLVVIALCFRWWSNKQKSTKDVLLFLAYAVGSYLCALIIYRVFLVQSRDVEGYASNETIELSYLIPGVLQNIKTYFTSIYTDFAFIWKVLIAGLVACFLWQSTRHSLQKKSLAFIASLIVLVLSGILSFGAYLTLKNPLFHPRAMYGFGVFLAILAVFCVFSNRNTVAKMVALALSWCFFVFAFSYGNALSDQQRYWNFRTTILMYDMSCLFPDSDFKEMTIQVEGAISPTAVVESIAGQAPVIKHFLPLSQNFKFDYLMYKTLLDHHNFGTGDKLGNNREADDFIDFATLDLPIVLNSYYHTIQSDGKQVLIVLKH
jgi:hypothetical protein